MPNAPQSRPSDAATTASVLPRTMALMFVESWSPITGNCASALSTMSRCSADSPKSSAATVTTKQEQWEQDKNP